MSDTTVIDELYTACIPLNIYQKFIKCTTIKEMSILQAEIAEMLENLDGACMEAYMLIYFKVLVDAILDTATDDDEIAKLDDPDNTESREDLLLRTISKIYTDDIRMYDKILHATTYGQLTWINSQVIAYLERVTRDDLIENLIFYYILTSSMIDTVENDKKFQAIGDNKIAKKRYVIDSRQVMLQSISLVREV